MGISIYRDSLCRCYEVVTDDGRPIAYTDGEGACGHLRNEHLSIYIPDRVWRELCKQLKEFECSSPKSDKTGAVTYPSPSI